MLGNNRQSTTTCFYISFHQGRFLILAMTYLLWNFINEIPYLALSPLHEILHLTWIQSCDWVSLLFFKHCRSGALKSYLVLWTLRHWGVGKCIQPAQGSVAHQDCAAPTLWHPAAMIDAGLHHSLEWAGCQGFTLGLISGCWWGSLAWMDGTIGLG